MPANGEYKTFKTNVGGFTMNISEEQKSRCHKIIHPAAIAAGGCGTIFIFPGSDTVPITLLQLKMIHSLAKVFGLNLTDQAAKATLALAAASAGGRQIVKTFTFWIPFGLGSIISASTAVGLTELIGWTIASEFAKESTRATAA